MQVFDRNGSFLRTFGEHGSLNHQLKNPEGLSINGNGDIIVTDTGNKLIKIFSSSGEYLHKFGGAGALVEPNHCWKIMIRKAKKKKTLPTRRKALLKASFHSQK